MIVADATTLVAMSLTDNLRVMKRLVGRVMIGEVTEREIRGVVEGLDPNCEPPTKEYVEVSYIDIPTPTLSRSETETVHLARRENAKLALTDDPVVRQELEPISVPAIGTPGILFAGHHRGLIDGVEENIRRLSDVGYALSDQCRDALLDEIK